MRAPRQNERGQATVEFALFSVALVLALMLVIQLTWIGVQKWQFNHFANYTARVWSVRQADSAGFSMLRILGAGAMSWRTITKDYVKFMWVSGEETRTLNNGHEDVQVDGLKFSGVATLMPLFRPFIGSAALVDFEIPAVITDLFPGVAIPHLGLVRYEVFVPMKKEPWESPSGDGQKFDNDCIDTPCTQGNKR